MTLLPDSFYWAAKGPVLDMITQVEENNLHIILVKSDVLYAVHSFGLMERDVLVVTIH